MRAKRDPLVYIDDILRSIQQIHAYIHDLTKEEVSNSSVVQDAIQLRFAFIGEAASQLPEEFKMIHKQVPWKLMADMRNKLLHEYFESDWNIIWETIQKDLPLLEKELKELL